MKPIYLQIFSMTDHTAALNQRFQGPYAGVNAELQTSEFVDGKVRVSNASKSPRGELIKQDFSQAKVILCYRHSDTGVLSGTSETLFALKQIPWTDMPGLEILEVNDKGEVKMKLWVQELTLVPGRVARVHFAKTIVYLKNFGAAEQVVWSDDALKQGPAHLHAEEIEDNLTIAPPTGSAIVVKMGQEIEH